MIDPEFWSDEEVGRWSFHTRLFYIAIWNFADDEGILKANSRLLKAQIFPYDEDVDIDKCKEETKGKVEWYSVNGQTYGFIRNFLKYQRIDRPTVSKLPKPNTLSEPSASPQRGILPNIREENIIEENDIYNGFENLWHKYPIKEGKKQALIHYKYALKAGHAHADIAKALRNYLKKIEVERTEPKYIKHGSTFFNNWEDFLTYKPKDEPKQRCDF
jgi:hypothetical protein